MGLVAPKIITAHGAEKLPGKEVAMQTTWKRGLRERVQKLLDATVTITAVVGILLGILSGVIVGFIAGFCVGPPEPLLFIAATILVGVVYGLDDAKRGVLRV